MQDDQTGMLDMVDAGMVDDAVDGGEGGSPAESETATQGHDPEAVAAMEKPQISDLQAAAGAFHSAFTTALYELDNTRRELAERSARVEELDEAILSVRAKLDAEVEAGRKREEEHFNEAGQLRQRIEEAEAECGRLQETAAAQEHALTERTAEIGDLTARLEELNSDLEQRTAAGIEAQQAFDNETGRLNSELAELQQALEEATGRLQAQQHELEQRDREVADLESRLNTLNEELEAKNGELARLDRQVDELQGRHEAQTEALRAQSETHAAARAELDSQLGRLTSELETLRVAQRDLQAHAEKLENLNQALHESSSTEKTVHRQQLEEKNAELESLNARLQAAQVTVRDLQDNPPVSDELQARLRELETRLHEAESRAAALVERAADADRMESLNSSLRGALSKARDAVSRSAGESDKVQVLNEQIAELQSALEQSRQSEPLHSGKPQAGDTPEGQTAQPGETAPGQEDNELVAQLRAALAAAEERCRQLETAQAAAVSAHDPGGTGQGVQALLREPAVDRAGFLTHLDELLAAGVKGEQGYTLMYILLDNFINIRDEIGVINSESVLNEVAQIIASVCDTGDLSARFGDCTFSVLCSNTTVEQTEQKADRIRTIIESRIFDDGGKSVVATASIGVSSVRQSDSSAHDVVSRADLACEAARLSGGNKVVSSGSADAEIGAPGNREIHEQTISRTLAENRIKIYYQPITNLREESGSHFEVLVRIVDEAGDIILPGEFFSMAETTGQSAKIDRYVIEQIVRTLSESRDPEVQLFIKLTRQSVADAGLPAWIAALIREHGVSAQQLVFEVAEAVMLADLGGLSSLSSALHETGCKVAIEHYRMSSQPKHLAHVHVDYLKIDASLVEEISRRGEPLARVAAIMELANKNGYVTIAEGVESSASLAILWELGVGLAQGYFIQAPAVSREVNDQDGDAGCNKAVFEIS